jgi:hypothetical protein
MLDICLIFQLLAKISLTVFQLIHYLTVLAIDVSVEINDCLVHFFF